MCFWVLWKHIRLKRIHVHWFMCLRLLWGHDGAHCEHLHSHVQCGRLRACHKRAHSSYLRWAVLRWLLLPRGLLLRQAKRLPCGLLLPRRQPLTLFPPLRRG